MEVPQSQHSYVHPCLKLPSPQGSREKRWIGLENSAKHSLATSENKKGKIHLVFPFEMCPNNHFIGSSFEHDPWNSAELLPFFPLLFYAYGSDMHLPGPRKFLPILVRGFAKSLCAQIQSTLVKSSVSLSAVKCSYLGLQGQSRAFTSASSLSFTREGVLWQSLRETLQDPGLFWTVVQLSFSSLYCFFACQRCRKTWEIEPLWPGSSPPEYRINPCLVLCVTWCWAEHRLESRNPSSGVLRSHTTVGAQ